MAGLSGQIDNARALHHMPLPQQGQQKALVAGQIDPFLRRGQAAQPRRESRAGLAQCVGSRTVLHHSGDNHTIQVATAWTTANPRNDALRLWRH